MGFLPGWTWILHVVLLIITLYVLIKDRKTKYLEWWIWLIIVIIVPLLGPIVYWVVDKRIFSK